MNKIQRIKIPKYKEQLDNLISAYANGELSQGKDIVKFKESLIKLFRYKYVNLTNSGNSAILMSIYALKLKNKKILIPAISSCFAIEKAVFSSGNNPVYGDVCINSSGFDYNILKSKNLEFDAIISPNFFGIRSDIENLKKFNKPIIEDACQSFLTNLEFASNAEFLIFSFYPTKIINAIDGGAVLTNNKEFEKNIRKHIYYDYQTSSDTHISFNLKMPNIHAAFGLGTLKNINKIKFELKEIINQYDFIIDMYSFVRRLGDNSDCILSRYVLKFDKQSQRDFFLEKINCSQIESSLELMKISSNLKQFPNSNELLKTTCSIPLYPSLESKNIIMVKNAIVKILNTLKNG
jgi:perosamine synthetase